MYRTPEFRFLLRGVVTMSTIVSWFVSIIVFLGLVLALHHLGIDVTAAIASITHGVEHFLNTPLLSV